MNRHRASQNRHNRPGQSRPQIATTPTIQQVVPGAAVSIVLKEDQPTGRETQGVVQDLLTRGNHPRGIKVRLQDGQVGRVQRIVSGDLVAPSVSENDRTSIIAPRQRREWKNKDIRLDDHPELPPARTLADFLPSAANVPADATGHSNGLTSEGAVKCPFCEFRGDEVAVSHHVDEHLD